jgi:hypothetical protein
MNSNCPENMRNKGSGDQISVNTLTTGPGLTIMYAFYK